MEYIKLTSEQIIEHQEMTRQYASQFDPHVQPIIEPLLELGVLPMWSCEGHPEKRKSGIGRGYVSFYYDQDLLDVNKMVAELQHNRRLTTTNVRSGKVEMAEFMNIVIGVLCCGDRYGGDNFSPIPNISIEWNIDEGEDKHHYLNRVVEIIKAGVGK